MTCRAPGTPEGLEHHRRRHERRCAECIKLSPRPWSRKPLSEDLDHGSLGMYQRELRDAAEPCDACKAANRDYIRSYRQRTGNLRTGCSPGLGWPLEDPVMARIGRAA